MAISDFLDCMPQTVTLEPLTSIDTYGKQTFGASTPYQARVVFKKTWIRSIDGQERVGQGIVWLGELVTIAVEDKLTLPDGSSPPILFSEQYPDEDGLHHTKIIFG